MKRITLVVAILFCLLASFGTSQATPLQVNTTSINLGTLHLETTGSLELSFGATAFSGRTSNSRSEVYRNGDEIGVRAVLTDNDLQAGSWGPYEAGTYYDWWGFVEANMGYTQHFTAIGSGHLKASIDTRWQNTTEPWPVPDLYPPGPDSHHTFLYIENATNGDWVPGGIAWEGFGTGDVLVKIYSGEEILRTDGTWVDSPEGIYFDDGQSGWLTIDLMAAAGGLYTNRPGQPVPEPSTLVLLGLGIAGLIAVGVRKRNQV